MNVKWPKLWYAVYTRPRWEKKVATLLTKKEIDVYCPLLKTKKQWADRKKVVLEPLFTSYVFVHVTAQEHLAVKQTDGIMNFVNWLGKPAIIRDEEIETVRKFLNEYEHIRLEKAEVNVNDRVRIIGGPLVYKEGDVIQVHHKTVKVYLPTLGYQMIAEIGKNNIEIVKEAKASRRLTP
jgi:transcription antitermination factor NusG